MGSFCGEYAGENLTGDQSKKGIHSILNSIR